MTARQQQPRRAGGDGELEPIAPADICWGEADGAISINPEVVAKRLNDLLALITELRQWSGQCACLNCHGVEPRV